MIVPFVASLLASFAMTTSAGSPHLVNAAPSSFSIDTTTEPGHRLLRYTSSIVNIGRKPFELRATRPSKTAPMATVVQRVYSATGYRDLPVVGASMSYAGDGHNHWHLNRLDVGNLYRVVDGAKVGANAKRGFCFFDNRDPGDGSKPYYTPANACASNTPDTLTVTMGLSSGWGDTYNAALMWQWVDITNLPDGAYTLREHLDNKLSLPAVNTKGSGARVDLRLTRDGVTVLRVRSSV